VKPCGAGQNFTQTGGVADIENVATSSISPKFREALKGISLM
jgi:hypothetical protein